ncbi:hypothetical protein GALMADRAFT_142352 [Galerina marginata CBS 339.88]|uniref:Uncharacterized protein n=1 Tax=Galerina marginata (strain CBS 339.88) TaxID=685588 RepID=A0A067SZU6_GALM3|nr:hypothetical protein GALMADRAFT_142352 [Galerina marginata CBS 339.88]
MSTVLVRVVLRHAKDLVHRGQQPAVSSIYDLSKRDPSPRAPRRRHFKAWEILGSSMCPHPLLTTATPSPPRRRLAHTLEVGSAQPAGEAAARLLLLVRDWTRQPVAQRQFVLLLLGDIGDKRFVAYHSRVRRTIPLAYGLWPTTHSTSAAVVTSSPTAIG